MHITEYISVHLCVPEPSPEKKRTNPYLHWKLKKVLSDHTSLGFIRIHCGHLRQIQRAPQELISNFDMVLMRRKLE